MSKFFMFLFLVVASRSLAQCSPERMAWIRGRLAQIGPSPERTNLENEQNNCGRALAQCSPERMTWISGRLTQIGPSQERTNLVNEQNDCGRSPSPAQNASPARASVVGSLAATANLAVRNPVVGAAVVVGVGAAGTVRAVNAVGGAARAVGSTAANTVGRLIPGRRR